MIGWVSIGVGLVGRPSMNTNIALGPSVSVPSGKVRTWVGRVTAAVVVLFLGFDTVLKVCLLGPAVEGSAKLGFSVETVMIIGLIELALIALYLVPRTAVIGAVLWTGYLGGAIATHVRMGDPLFSHTLFPIYVAIMLWLPLFLRDKRVRALVLSN